MKDGTHRQRHKSTSSNDAEERICCGFKQPGAIQALLVAIIAIVTFHLTMLIIKLINEKDAYETPDPYTKLEDMPQRIFFVHYSSKPPLPSTLCAVRTAAALNPNWTVTLFSDPKPEPSFKHNLPNIKVVDVDLWKEMSETPIASWWTTMIRDMDVPMDFRMAAKGLALSHLYKHGGVFLENDVILQRPLNWSEIMNTIGAQSRRYLNAAYLAFEEGHILLSEVMIDWQMNTTGCDESCNGRKLWTDATAGYLDVADTNSTNATAADFLREIASQKPDKRLKILPIEMIYSIPMGQAKKLMEAGHSDLLRFYLEASQSKPLAVHLWANVNKNRRIEKGSLAYKLLYESGYCKP